MSDEPAEWIPRWIRANGLEFGYLERGEGPLVLCLHGFPDSAWSFRPLLLGLAAAGFRAVAPFMRGYRPTGIPADGDYRISTLGRDVIALIDHFEAPGAHVVGHDWGAAAAYAAATLRPDRVHSVVAAAVPHLRRFVLRPSPRQLYRSRYMALFQFHGLAERVVLRHDLAWLDRLIREWSPGWDWAPADFAAVKANLREPARLTAALGYYRAMAAGLVQAESWRLLMRPVTVPTRVICGARDGCIGREMFDGQEHLFSSAHDLVEFAEAGHFMHLERPGEFTDAVLGWVSRAA